ncbi:MAG: hypothetical protein DSY89_00800 [Deltaproteobacteria bacterium]|nr:MAG: hypothetical protein DSY89_00800 [Deltaproteobacteria bacterium]
MWDAWDIKSKPHRRSFDHPEIYGFIDVSQNNQKKGQVHWDNLQWVRRYIAKTPRPMNMVKTYGVDGGRFGNTREGIDRWWRNIIGGAAAVRFQRPGNGLGLSTPAANAIRSARMLESLVKLWDVAPANQLLGERAKNEAYLAAAPSQDYVLYFTDGGSVTLDLEQVDETFDAKWIDINNARWGRHEIIHGGKKAVITAPGKGHWVVALVKSG